MLPEERYDRIRVLLANFQRVPTDRIAIDLGVSRETVRRDVLRLEQLGELRRVYGGVVALGHEPEPPIGERSRVRMNEKRQIARAAAKLLTPGKSLFIDAGSTVSTLAEELASLSGLTVVTNSFEIALKLVSAEPGGAPRHEVVVLGGRPQADLAATYGDVTVAEIHRYRADYAFVSPVGLSATQGATSYNYPEAEVARAMIAQSARVVILADHSKIGVSSRVSFCPADSIDILITDARSEAQPGFADLRSAGCKIVLA
jgi:DeoR/GlpR family transcriptional regulator of sugar metabolism